MPRKSGLGPGSAKMGGGGKKPPMPSTPFGGPAQGAMPGGSMSGASPRGGPRAMPGAMPGGGGSSGIGAAGFKKGGSSEHVKKHEKGGAVHGDEKEDRALFKKMEKEEERPGKKERAAAYAHGGPVIAGHGLHGLKGTPHKAGEGITTGPDLKRSAGAHGADSRVRHGHSGKAG